MFELNRSFIELETIEAQLTEAFLAAKNASSPTSDGDCPGADSDLIYYLAAYRRIRDQFQGDLISSDNMDAVRRKLKYA